MHKSIISFWVSSLLAIATAWGDPGAFRAAIDVTQVEATGASWRVAGWIYDSTTAGFTGDDVSTGQVLCCESIYRDTDIYTVDQVITQTVSWAEFVCSYSGTGSAARVGQPTFGQAYISAAFGTNLVPLPSYTGPSGPSPSLRDGIAAVAVRRLASQGGGGGLGEQGPPGTNTATGDWYAITNKPEVVTNGATVTLYSTNTAPAGTELVAANVVRGWFSRGLYFYNSTNTTTSGYDTNSFEYVAGVAPNTFSRSYTITGANQYVGSTFTPRMITNPHGPATVTIYAGCLGGSVELRPELYFTLDKTNTVYEAQDVGAQTVGTGSNGYSWVISFPDQATAWVMRRAKVISKTGSPTLTIYGGTNHASTLSITEGSSAGGGAPAYTNRFTGAGTTGAVGVAAGTVSGFLKYDGSFADPMNGSASLSNIIVSITNNWTFDGAQSVYSNTVTLPSALGRRILTELTTTGTTETTHSYRLDAYATAGSEFTRIYSFPSSKADQIVSTTDLAVASTYALGLRGSQFAAGDVLLISSATGSEYQRILSRAVSDGVPALEWNGPQEKIACFGIYSNKLYAGQGTGVGDGDVLVFDDTNTFTVSFDSTNDQIYDFCVFSNNLYASMGSSNTLGDIVTFNGSSWSTSFDGPKTKIESLAVYNGQLYAGQPNEIVVSPNGVTWTTNKTFTSIENVYTLCVYDGKLYAGLGVSAGDGDVWVYDGITWSKSYDGSGAQVLDLFVYNGKLYASVTGDVLEFDGVTWSTSYDGGLTIWSFVVYDGRLYATCNNGTGPELVVFDGSTWATAWDPGSALWGSISYRQKLFLSVGVGGDVYAMQSTNTTSFSYPLANNHTNAVVSLVDELPVGAMATGLTYKLTFDSPPLSATTMRTVTEVLQ